jgi:hypothetical protein
VSQLHHRNGNAAACQGCGGPIIPQRGSRRQRFCNRRCRERAYPKVPEAQRLAKSEPIGSPHSDLKRVPATPLQRTYVDQFKIPLINQSTIFVKIEVEPPP